MSAARTREPYILLVIDVRGRWIEAKLLPWLHLSRELGLPTPGAASQLKSLEFTAEYAN